MHEVDWHELDGTKFAVDTPNELVDDSSQILVLFDVLATRYGNLDKDHFAYPLRMLGEENFQSVQLLWHALDVVKTVNTNDELHALELLLECGDTFLHLWLFESFLELLRVDPNWEGANRDHLPLVFDSVRCGSKSPKENAISIYILHVIAVTHRIREQLLRKCLA